MTRKESLTRSRHSFCRQHPFNSDNRRSSALSLGSRRATSRHPLSDAYRCPRVRVTLPSSQVRLLAGSASPLGWYANSFHPLFLSSPASRTFAPAVSHSSGTLIQCSKFYPLLTHPCAHLWNRASSSGARRPLQGMGLAHQPGGSATGGASRQPLATLEGGELKRLRR